MDVAEWQRRLEETFGQDGIVGPRVYDLIEKEKDYGFYVTQKFIGYNVLTDSFFDFYMETLEKTSSSLQQDGIPPGYSNYQLIVLLYLINFRSFRAAENLLLRGYPLDGYALLRDLKDRAIFLAAIINGISSFSALYFPTESGSNSQGITDEEYKQIKKRRKKEEHRVLRQMVRDQSGLDSEHLAELKEWEGLFHEEVHGSKFSFALEGGQWLRGKEPLWFAPRPKKRSIGMYVNRSNEIGWMLLRSLPFLQLSSGAFGEDWAKKWTILDDSFRLAVEALGEMDKEIAWAIIHLIDKKFQFSPDLAYIERQ